MSPRPAGSTIPSPLCTPGVVLRDDHPGRLALRIIERAIDYGWPAEAAQRLVEHGRAAHRGARWCPDQETGADIEAELLRQRSPAFAWLAGHATAPGFELVDRGDTIVLYGPEVTR
jgi:hypothetical protein